MVNRHRAEAPGAWHHVMNRGVARRTVIEGQRDADEFQGAVLGVVKEGLLEVHAYCLMATHFHLLVRSPVGELSLAMKIILNRHSRYFNRSRRRDGPLWRGRFLSKPIRSETYWRVLVSYIDHNPVKAGIVANPADYRLGSAQHYMLSKDQPAWLHRAQVEAIVCRELQTPSYDPLSYVRVFGKPVTRSQGFMIDQGFGKHDPERLFLDLVDSAPQAVQDWMQRKASLADGLRAGASVLAPEALMDSIALCQRLDADWWIGSRKPMKSGWLVLGCALLQQVCGCSLDDIAGQFKLAVSTVNRYLNEHRSAMLLDEVYAQRAAEVLSAVLLDEFP